MRPRNYFPVERSHFDEYDLTTLNYEHEAGPAPGPPFAYLYNICMSIHAQTRTVNRINRRAEVSSPTPRIPRFVTCFVIVIEFAEPGNFAKLTGRLPKNSISLGYRLFLCTQR